MAAPGLESPKLPTSREKPGNNNDAANIALAASVHSKVIKNTGRPDGGIRRARYSVLTNIKHPAILLEGGFLSNEEEGALIKDAAYQDRLAISIADAVAQYKKAPNAAHVRKYLPQREPSRGKLLKETFSLNRKPFW